MKNILKNISDFFQKIFNGIKNISREKITLLLYVLIIILAGTVISGGLLFFSTFQELNTLKANRQQIVKEHTSFLSSKQDLEQEVISLMRENKKMRANIEENRLLVESLSESLRKNYKQIRSLENQIEGLQSDNQKLRDAQKKLQDELEQYKDNSALPEKK